MQVMHIPKHRQNSGQLVDKLAAAIKFIGNTTAQN